MSIKVDIAESYLSVDQLTQFLNNHQIYDTSGYSLLAKDRETGTVYEVALKSDIKEKYEELLSYLPKVPTQPYEKELAKRLIEVEKELTNAKEEAEHWKNSYKILSRASNDLLEEKDIEIKELKKQLGKIE